jgi:hypothetical protein
MGHKRHSGLHKSKVWRKIVAEIGDYAFNDIDVGSLAANTLQHVQAQYSSFENDPSIKSTLEFLLHVSYAFKQVDPIKYLNDNNIIDSDELSVIKLSRAAANYKSDEVSSHEYQTFARQAVVDAIANWYRLNIEAGRSLFHEGIDSNLILRKASSGSGFSELSRLYFSKITERYLKYYLEREAAAALPNLGMRSKFSDAIESHISDISKHAFETTKIAQSFAAGWFNKFARNNFPQEKDIINFIGVSLHKMKSELLREAANERLYRIYNCLRRLENTNRLPPSN